MEFWLGLYGMQSPRTYPRSFPWLYREVVRHAALAEDLGFDGFALTEHHFWYDGYCPSLLPVLAAIARRTRRIRIAPCALLLPLQHPLRVAEQAAMVDHLSHGRLEIAFGYGYRSEEYEGFGVEKAARGARVSEAVEVVRRAFTGERFDFAGRYCRIRNVAIAPRTLQQPHPPLWLAGGSQPATARRAGQLGVGYWAPAVALPFERVADLVKEYRAAARAAGAPAATIRVGVATDVAIAEAVARAKVRPQDVDEVFVAHNRQSGNGPNPGRTAAVLGGIPASVPAHTINMACPAGLRATIEAAQAIRLGECEVALVCGMESMSTIPHLLVGARWKTFRSGPIVIEDEFFSMVEPLSQMATIDLAERTAAKYAISREEQEAFAVESHRKAARAWDDGRYAAEVVPVELPATKERPAASFTRDEGFRADASREAMARLEPARKGGTVTAATSSGVTDGAAAVVMTSARRAREIGVAPLASLVACVQVGLDPADMLEGPAVAIPRVLDKAGLALHEIDLLEVNEAFAAQVLANERVLRWDRSRLNVHGGAIALGHPTGFTGVRLLVTLAHALRAYDGRLGLIALCGGGGLGVAMILRRVEG